MIAHLSAKFQAATAKIVDLAVKYVRFLYHILHFTGSLPKAGTWYLVVLAGYSVLSPLLLLCFFLCTNMKLYKACHGQDIKETIIPDEFLERDCMQAYTSEQKYLRPHKDYKRQIPKLWLRVRTFAQLRWHSGRKPLYR